MIDPTPFSVSSSKIGPHALGMRIDGELDVYTARDVHDELASISPDVRFVLADLTGVSFMDSAGMASLLAAARVLRARDGAMMLVAGSAGVLRVLEVTGVARYFEIRDDYDAAARELVGPTLH
jgi:anti-anti-sigma factor